jgi:hypothetical protein
MQVRTPARQPGPRVGLDDVPSRYEAKQAGLDRTLLAAYTGTHRRHTRDRPLGLHGHCIRKSTVSAGLPYRSGDYADGAAEAWETDEARGIRVYSGACAIGPAGERTAGPSAPRGSRGSRGSWDETAASDLMSIRQPVSLAASLAFWPSLPIASDSW